LDDTGLYYYGARYYDAEIGRFISADSIVPDPMNPQAFNRYSYVLNNPVKYTDPTGYYDLKKAAAGALIIVAVELPVVVFGGICIFQPELIPAFLGFVEYYEIVTAPAVILGGYLIITGLQEEDIDEPNIPELPLDKSEKDADTSPITSPSDDTTPEPDKSGPPQELIDAQEKYGGELIQRDDGTWSLII
jgi:RHS repeat-associated protein